MPYSIEIDRHAIKTLKRIPRPQRERIVRAIESLGRDPRPDGVTKLSGRESFYRIRVGEYRVVYTIKDDILTVYVLRVGDRKDIYRHLVR